MYSRIGIACLLVCLGVCGTAWAGTIEVAPTGTVADIHNVKAAIDGAQPGDIILLKAGTFDWSGNSVAFPPFVIPVGLPISVSNITITGETAANGDLLTSIVGPVDGDGFPQIYTQLRSGNTAFSNGPGVTGVTIRNLILENFETAVGLVQNSNAGQTGTFAPGADYSGGADDFVVEGLWIKNSRQGIMAWGANDRLLVRNSRVEIVIKQGAPRAGRGIVGLNAFGIASLMFVPQLGFDPPSDLVFEGNVVRGPGPDLETLVNPDGTSTAFTFGGIAVQGGLGLRFEANDVEGFPFGLRPNAEGAISVVRNTASNCQHGLQLADFSGQGIPTVGTTGVLVKNNLFTGNVIRPDAPFLRLASGTGIFVFADNNRLVGNNVENNEFAGIVLLGDETTPASDTATGNLILGNKNVVVGSPFVLTNNTISGSKASALNVGQAMKNLLIQPPPFD